MRAKTDPPARGRAGPDPRAPAASSRAVGPRWRASSSCAGLGVVGGKMAGVGLGRAGVAIVLGEVSGERWRGRRFRSRRSTKLSLEPRDDIRMTHGALARGRPASDHSASIASSATRWTAISRSLSKLAPSPNSATKSARIAFSRCAWRERMSTSPKRTAIFRRRLARAGDARVWSMFNFAKVVRLLSACCPEAAANAMASCGIVWLQALRRREHARRYRMPGRARGIPDEAAARRGQASPPARHEGATSAKFCRKGW